MTGHKLTDLLGRHKKAIREFAEDFNVTIEKDENDSIIISGNGRKFEFRPKAEINIEGTMHRGLYKDLITNSTYPYYNVRARLMQIFEVNKYHFS